MLRWLSISLLLAVAVELPLVIVEGEQPAFVPRSALAGSEVPEAYVYRTFFMVAHEVLLGSPPIRDHFVTQLGLEPGSAAAEAFGVAVDEAWDLIVGERPPNVTFQEAAPDTTVVTTTIAHREPASDGPAPEVLRRQEREEARRLGAVIGELSARLAALGQDFDSIERHVRESFAPSTRLTSSDEIGPDHHTWQVQRAFDQGRDEGRRSANEEVAP